MMVDMRRPQQWRTWLSKHHPSSPGVWLVFYKDHTGKKSIPYEESVREALCFGWIDSLIKRLDDDRYARKFTPRKPTSKWSGLNRRRWRELKAAGRLAAAGLAAAPTGKAYARPPVIPKLPAYVARALKTSARAWAVFRTLPPSHRREYVAWIYMARRPETRERRVRAAIALLTAGKKLGLK
jgi:uncharacterized protein YdeI (YjbR/CyaY-like superfamily)